MKFGKFIRNLSMCLAVVCITVFGFAACGGLSTLKDNPAPSDLVTGNGGLAVTKGDYVYFVNGFLATSDIGTSNKYGNIDYSAIYRVKLVDGKVALPEPEYDDDGNVKVDKTESILNLEIIVPKVAGYEYSNLYIFGDYIYFTTPNSLENKNHEVQSKYLDFYRAKLDRSGNIELLYTSENENASVSFTMYQIGKEVYQIIKDGDKLVLNTISNSGNGSVAKKTIEDEKVNDASLPVYENSNDVIDEIDYSIYYTVNVNDTTTAVKQYDLSNGETFELVNVAGEKYVIKNTKNGDLYYTHSSSNMPGFDAYVCVNNLKGESFQAGEYRVSNRTVNDYYLTSREAGRSIIYTDSSKTYYKEINKDARIILDTGSLTFVTVQGDDLYYIADSTLKKINYRVSGSTAETVIPTTDTIKSDLVAAFDVDGYNIYYFAKHQESYYLHFVTFNPAIRGEDGGNYSHFIGKLKEADYIPESTETE